MTPTSVFPLDKYSVLNAVQLGLIELPADAQVIAVAREMAEHSVHCVIIRGIERHGWGDPVGIISTLDVARFASL
jgi:hypothetical protein